MSDPTTLGELIRERRLARGLSLGQLATAVGRTAATVRSWERDQHSPAVDVVDRLASALDVEESQIEALMFQESPSLTVVRDEPDADEEPAESTSVGADASVETDEGSGDDDTADVGLVESAPAGVSEAEAAFTAASADELGLMPRIQFPGVTGPADDESVEIELVEAEPGVDVSPEPEEVTADLVDEAALEDLDTVEVILDEPAAVEEAIAEPELSWDAGEAAETAADQDVEIDRSLVDEPTAAIGPPIAAPQPVETGHVGVAVRTEMLQEPSLPPFLAPLRGLFDPDKKWLYWVRGSLTVVVMLVMLLVLAWAAGELFDGLGEVLDTIESTDSVASDFAPLN